LFQQLLTRGLATATFRAMDDDFFRHRHFVGIDLGKRYQPRLGNMSSPVLGRLANIHQDRASSFDPNIRCRSVNGTDWHTHLDRSSCHRVCHPMPGGFGGRSAPGRCRSPWLLGEVTATRVFIDAPNGRLLDRDQARQHQLHLIERNAGDMRHRHHYKVPMGGANACKSPMNEASEPELTRFDAPNVHQNTDCFPASWGENGSRPQNPISRRGTRFKPLECCSASVSAYDPASHRGQRDARHKNPEIPSRRINWLLPPSVDADTS